MQAKSQFTYNQIYNDRFLNNIYGKKVLYAQFEPASISLRKLVYKSDTPFGFNTITYIIYYIYNVWEVFYPTLTLVDLLK